MLLHYNNFRWLSHREFSYADTSASRQKGISLIITFFIMTILLVTVLSISTILFNEVKMISNASNAISSFYSSNSGVEKTLYYAKKQIPAGGYTGVCNICNACNSSDCQNCVTTPLATGGCDLINCNNCHVTYNSSFNNRTYAIDATISPGSNLTYSVLNISSKGLYSNTTRVLATSQQIQLPPSNDIIRIQNVNFGQHRGKAANFMWPVATTAGNTIIVIASVTDNRGGNITSPITASAGWSTAVSYTGNAVATSIFYIAGASAQRLSGTFTSPLASSRTEWGIIGIEYSGILSPSPLDKVASSGTFGTTVTTGTTATTTQANELWVGGIGNENKNIINSPTNGFSVVDTENNFVGLTALEKVVTTTGTASTGGTVPSGDSSGVMATFKKGSSSIPSPTLVQKQKNTGTTSVSATWPSATTAGNLLIAIVSNGMITGAQGTVSAPSGWTQAVTDRYSSNGGPRITIFYRANAPSQTSTGNFTSSGVGEAMSLIVAEYSGIVASTPLDRTASSGNQLTASPITGITTNTIQESELLIGAIGSRGGVASNPVNGFSIVDQMQQGGTAGNAILLQKVVYSIGAYSSGVTTASSNQSAGAIATFKMVP